MLRIIHTDDRHAHTESTSGTGVEWVSAAGSWDDQRGCALIVAAVRSHYRGRPEAQRERERERERERCSAAFPPTHRCSYATVLMRGSTRGCKLQTLHERAPHSSALEKPDTWPRWARRASISLPPWAEAHAYAGAPIRAEVCAERPPYLGVASAARTQPPGRGQGRFHGQTSTAATDARVS